MKLYNTLTRKKEEFVPIEANKVKMYLCGPTVYNYIHIGNARPEVVFDAIRRYLEYKGYDVAFIHNFTDVDDKIIAKANAEGVATDVITKRYIEEFLTDVNGLNVKEATCRPRVTEVMDDIIKMIDTLVTKGFAYEKEGTVYFDAGKLLDYGKLSKKNIDDLEVGARVEADDRKNSVMDFVLWKPAKPDEPKWQSPWGEGRPGWHIECSAMAKKYLGDTIDIHAGGEDLIFPHHENEIAQSEAANGAKFANYWLHNGMVNVDNQKMAKSKGNFFTVRDIVAKFPYDVMRFYILSVHYRSPVNFSDELLQSAQNSLDRIKNCVRNLNDLLQTDVGDGVSGVSSDTPNISQFRTDFETAMDDDFNTANAITAIFELVKFANVNADENSSKSFISKLLDEILLLCGILGIETSFNQSGDTGLIESMIEARQKARQGKNWAEADKIRDSLIEMGVVIKDTPDGVKWFYKGNA